MISKIKFEQRYLDDGLKTHVKELLGNLANIASEDEADGDKENLNENDDDAYETEEDEQVEDGMDSENSKLTKDSFKNKNDQNNNLEESMEIT